VNVILAAERVVKGNFNATGNIELLCSAKKLGDIKTNALSIAEGSQFYGKSSMTIKKHWSGNEMMIFFRKHMRAIFIVIIVTFLGGIFLGAGSYLFNKSSDFAAKINGTKIPMNLFYSIYKSSVKSYQHTTNKSLNEKELNEIKARVIQTLVQTELFCQEAKKYGIIVTDEELKFDLQNSLEFKDGDSFNIIKYTAFIKNDMQMNPKDYENLRKKKLMANKVKMIMASSVKLWNYEVESASKQNPPIYKNDLFFTKVNVILTEWYGVAIRNSNVISNNMIFKVT
jgi:hypothetical protein